MEGVITNKFLKKEYFYITAGNAGGLFFYSNVNPDIISRSSNLMIIKYFFNNFNW
jgi:hypothetical protein